MSNKKNFVLSRLVEEDLQGLSPIQTIMKMAEDRNIRKMGLDPKNVISFGGGWCNHRAPKELVEAYNEIVNSEDLFHKSGRYSEIIGDYNCREQLSRFEKEIYGLSDLTPDNILIGQSSTQLFHDVLRVMSNPGDLVGLLDPTYANYINSVKCAVPGSKIKYIPALDINSWEYMPDSDYSLENLKKYCERGLRNLVIPVPDNPTSQIPDDSFIKGCIEILDDYNGFLVLDYAYKALWFDNMPKVFSFSPKDYPNLILINSNSKWLSSLGRRFGWVEADKKIIKSLEKLNESVLLSPDTMHSMATSSFLKKTLENNSLKKYIENTRKLYKNTSEVMIKNLDKFLGWNRLEPMGGLYTVSPTPNGKEPVSFIESVFKNTGVLLIPGAGFGPSMEKAVRLSYGPLCYDHDKIKEGFERISEFSF